MAQQRLLRARSDQGWIITLHAQTHHGHPAQSVFPNPIPPLDPVGEALAHVNTVNTGNLSSSLTAAANLKLQIKAAHTATTKDVNCDVE